MTTRPFRDHPLSKDDAAVLLIDHQSGLISLVQDHSPAEFRDSVLALADVARFFALPTIPTTSFEDGPNGPLVPELKEGFPEAPDIARPGQISAWGNEDLVQAEVFVVNDASGTFNTSVRDAALDRMSAAGAQLMNWYSVACELHRDWRNDLEGLGARRSDQIPNYRNRVTS